MLLVLGGLTGFSALLLLRPRVGRDIAVYQLMRQVGTECGCVAVELLMWPNLEGDPLAALNHDPPHVGQKQTFAGYRYVEGQSLICEFLERAVWVVVDDERACFRAGQ